MTSFTGNTNGFFGDKYEYLESSKAQIEASGAKVPEAIGISQEVIDSVLVNSGLPTIDESASLSPDSPHLADISGRIVIPDEVTDGLVESAINLASHFNGPVITRSSGRGDAVGIGVYESVIHGTDPEDVRSAFSSVAGSYFTDRAIIYRDRKGLEPGYGMFMQPVVGNNLQALDKWEAMERKWLPVFTSVVSGNVKIGTPRNPQGVIRLNQGLGSGVNDRNAPVIEFGTDYDNNSLVLLPAIYRLDHMLGDRYADDRGDILYLEEGKWKTADKYNRYGSIPSHSELTGKDIQSIAQSLQRELGSPCYFEFAVREEDGEKIVYIHQIAPIETSSGNAEVSIESIPQESIILDNVNVFAGGVNTEPCTKIVCLSHGEGSQTDLYEFDRTKEATDGYILVYHASATSKSQRIDIRNLKNVRALVDLESMDWGHASGTPEQHLIGYSDQLGIPLLNIFDRGSKAWRKLNGVKFDRDSGDTSGNRHAGKLIIRDGKFGVYIDSTTDKAIIANLS